MDDKIEVVMNRLKNLESEWISLSERMGRIEGRLAELMTQNKPLQFMTKTSPQEIPKNVREEISSLKEIMSRLSTDNEQFRRMLRDVRLTQMENVTHEVFMNFVSRVNSLEKKIVETEKELSKAKTNL